MPTPLQTLLLRAVAEVNAEEDDAGKNDLPKAQTFMHVIAPANSYDRNQIGDRRGHDGATKLG